MSEIDRHIERMASTGSTGSMVEWCAFTNEIATLRTRAEAAEAELTALRGVAEAAQALVELNDNHGPFGGEMYQDRIDRAWQAITAALDALKAEG